MFHVSDSVGAYELYHRAFGVEKIYEETLPWDGVYITVEINGSEWLLRPSNSDNTPPKDCCIKLASEQDLRKAYDILTEEGEGAYQPDWHWTPLAALVKDKYGVGWMMCV